MRTLNVIAEKFKRLLAYEIFTDGSSKNGVGSWAYVITRRGWRIRENSGRELGANSNTMEFRAAIEALSRVRPGALVTVFSDSRILVDTMKFGDGPAAHQGQIEILECLCKERQVQWQWVKAHSGNKFNERCDELCILARS